MPPGVRSRERTPWSRKGWSAQGRTTRSHFARRLSFERLARRQLAAGRFKVREEGPAWRGPTPHAGRHAR
eukprot:6087901-Alexandrium_andersonii.AAC.1